MRGQKNFTIPSGGSCFCKERCVSGLNDTLGKRTYSKEYPGFESLPLRQFGAQKDLKQASADPYAMLKDTVIFRII